MPYATYNAHATLIGCTRSVHKDASINLHHPPPLFWEKNGCPFYLAGCFCMLQDQMPPHPSPYYFALNRTPLTRTHITSQQQLLHLHWHKDHCITTHARTHANTCAHTHPRTQQTLCTIIACNARMRIRGSFAHHNLHLARPLLSVSLSSWDMMFGTNYIHSFRHRLTHTLFSTHVMQPASQNGVWEGGNNDRESKTNKGEFKCQSKGILVCS